MKTYNYNGVSEIIYLIIILHIRTSQQISRACCNVGIQSAKKIKHTIHICTLLVFSKESFQNQRQKTNLCTMFNITENSLSVCCMFNIKKGLDHISSLKLCGFCNKTYAKNHTFASFDKKLIKNTTPLVVL